MKDMVFKYKVSLPGLKGFYRIYQADGACTLYDFHKRMRSDMDFPQDQLVLFKAFGADGTLAAKYASVDIGSGAIDSVSLQSCHDAGQDGFVYFYDTTNVKSVLVDLVEILETARFTGVDLIDLKGPNPIEFENGYVAFEDLPDDKRKRLDNPDGELDDEDADEDGDAEDDAGEDDDAEEIYDEDEK